MKTVPISDSLIAALAMMTPKMFDQRFAEWMEEMGLDINAPHEIRDVGDGCVVIGVGRG